MMDGVRQAFAAAAHMIVARHLKDEDTNVCLLYLAVIHTVGSIALTAILREPVQLPNSWLLVWLLIGCCKPFHISEILFSLH